MKTIDAVAKRHRKNRFLYRNLKTALVGGIAYQEQGAVLQRGIKLYKKPNQTLLPTQISTIDSLWGKLWGKHKNLLLPIDKMAERVSV